MTPIPSPEQVALARRAYVEGVAVKDILAETGLKLGTFYRCIDGRFPDGSGIQPARIERRRAGVRVRHRLGSRGALVARMWRTAERQVAEIEDRLRVSGLKQGERESNARMLATVARTLRELSSVDDARGARKGGSKDDNDDGAPRNIDELRRALAEKLEAIVGDAEDAVSGEAETR
jgi:hypothetical protein